MTSKNPSTPPPRRGRIVIEEAAQLFQQLRFSHRYGAYAEGQYVAVSVDPRWNADETTFRVMISCVAFGQRQVDWAQLPVSITSESGSGPSALTRFSAQGQTLLPSLPPGEYRLSLRLTPMRMVPVLSQLEERLAAQAAGDTVEERYIWQGASEDNALMWTLEETEDAEVQITFETTEAHLAGATIMFDLLDPITHQVHYHQQLRLEPTRTPEKWEAWCALGPRKEFPGPYDLNFDIVHPEQ